MSPQPCRGRQAARFLHAEAQSCQTSPRQGRVAVDDDQAVRVVEAGGHHRQFGAAEQGGVGAGQLREMKRALGLRRRIRDGARLDKGDRIVDPLLKLPVVGYAVLESGRRYPLLIETGDQRAAGCEVRDATPAQAATDSATTASPIWMISACEFAASFSYQ